MNKILVPTDFSKTANKAAKVAAQIAKANNGSVTFFHIVDMPTLEGDMASDGGDAGPFMARLMEYSKKRLKKFTSQSFLEGVEVHAKMVYDNPVQVAVASMAKEVDASLIVVGTHGSSGLDEVLIGSTAEKIIRTSEVPVLAIKNDFDNFNPKRIVYASNFYNEANTTFKSLVSFCELFDAELHLLKVITPGRFENTSYSEKLIQDFANNADLENYKSHIYNHDDVEEGVLEFCRNNEVGVLAIATHQRTGLSRLLNGSVAEGIANHAQFPVLTFKINEEEESEGVIFPSV